MAGTRVGGVKASQTLKQRYGMNYYQVIGAQGGKASNTGGFYANRELARVVGQRGGRASRKVRERKLIRKG